ncbi:hypothetical protein BDEG_27505 [Batrachochytrium dendrobatidis JEL423]|uniref:Uncharacterized protein n=1 Tax=Batrachochytrium dendrobatidis (strain JEL423) TaxID=403673 RepID=A0A177WVZ9_BATDL|nr:hypothetical protein BDEG_27505 [Batrachochytrium dendrobatidis JEL423]
MSKFNTQLDRFQKTAALSRAPVPSDPSPKNISSDAIPRVLPPISKHSVHSHGPITASLIPAPQSTFNQTQGYASTLPQPALRSYSLAPQPPSNDAPTTRARTRMSSAITGPIASFRSGMIHSPSNQSGKAIHQRSISAPSRHQASVPHHLEPIHHTVFNPIKDKSISFNESSNISQPYLSTSDSNSPVNSQLQLPAQSTSQNVSNGLITTSTALESAHHHLTKSAHPTSTTNSPYSSHVSVIKPSGSMSSIRVMSRMQSISSAGSGTNTPHHSRMFSTGAGTDRSNAFLTTKKDVEFLSKLIQDQGSIDVTQRDKEAWTRKVLKMEIKSAEKEMRHHEKTIKKGDKLELALDTPSDGWNIGSGSIGIGSPNGSTVSATSIISTSVHTLGTASSSTLPTAPAKVANLMT